MSGSSTRPGVVALIAALDTKGDDASFIRHRLEAGGVQVRTVDVGVLADPTTTADYPANDVAERGGSPLTSLRQRNDRAAAVAVMTEGARVLISELLRAGEIDAVFAIGGGAGTTIGAAAMRELPLGVPKVILTTVAAGNTANYLGTSDIVLFPSVVDVAGVNSISALTYTAAADAMVGMVNGLPTRTGPATTRPVIGASMFGVTTPAVMRAKQRLEDSGCEVIVFHATGSGGRTMERLCAEGHFAAVLDLTTTEWADETVGGILSAGPDRLSAAARTGTPQVVSVGATDMVNFGRRDSVPEQFADRTFYEHNAENTLMRVNAEEAARIGENIGRQLSQATGPTVVLLPAGGVSALDAPGAAFDDPQVREHLAAALVAQVDPTVVRVIRVDHHINDPEFADLATEQLLDLLAHVTSEQGRSS